MYKTIISPENGNAVPISSKAGMRILKKYRNISTGGGPLSWFMSSDPQDASSADNFISLRAMVLRNLLKSQFADTDDDLGLLTFLCYYLNHKITPVDDNKMCLADFREVVRKKLVGTAKINKKIEIMIDKIIKENIKKLLTFVETLAAAPLGATPAPKPGPYDEAQVIRIDFYARGIQWVYKTKVLQGMSSDIPVLVSTITNQSQISEEESGTKKTPGQMLAGFTVDDAAVFGGDPIDMNSAIIALKKETAEAFKTAKCAEPLKNRKVEYIAEKNLGRKGCEPLYRLDADECCKKDAKASVRAVGKAVKGGIIWGKMTGVWEPKELDILLNSNTNLTDSDRETYRTEFAASAQHLERTKVDLDIDWAINSNGAPPTMTGGAVGDEENWETLQGSARRYKEIVMTGLTKAGYVESLWGIIVRYIEVYITKWMVSSQDQLDDCEGHYWPNLHEYFLAADTDLSLAKTAKCWAGNRRDAAIYWVFMAAKHPKTAEFILMILSEYKDQVCQEASIKLRLSRFYDEEAEKGFGGLPGARDRAYYGNEVVKAITTLEQFLSGDKLDDLFTLFKSLATNIPFIGSFANIFVHILLLSSKKAMREWGALLTLRQNIKYVKNIFGGGCLQLTDVSRWVYVLKRDAWERAALLVGSPKRRAEVRAAIKARGPGTWKRTAANAWVDLDILGPRRDYIRNARLPARDRQKEWKLKMSPDVDVIKTAGMTDEQWDMIEEDWIVHYAITKNQHLSESSRESARESVSNKIDIRHLAYKLATEAWAKTYVISYGSHRGARGRKQRKMALEEEITKATKDPVKYKFNLDQLDEWQVSAKEAKLDHEHKTVFTSDADGNPLSEEALLAKIKQAVQSKKFEVRKEAFESWVKNTKEQLARASRRIGTDAGNADASVVYAKCLQEAKDLGIDFTEFDEAGALRQTVSPSTVTQSWWEWVVGAGIKQTKEGSFVISQETLEALNKADEAAAGKWDTTELKADAAEALKNDAEQSAQDATTIRNTRAAGLYQSQTPSVSPQNPAPDSSPSPSPSIIPNTSWSPSIPRPEL